MSKMTAKVRNELLNMLKKERADARCKLCKELHAEGKDLTKDLDSQIDLLRRKLTDLETQKAMVLDEAKLSTFTVGYGQCASDVLHPRLVAFDVETNEKIKDLLTS